MSPFDFSHIIPGDEIDPLKAAEDRAKEAEKHLQQVNLRWLQNGRSLDAKLEMVRAVKDHASAVADLAALRRNLATTDEIPFLPRDL